MKRTTLVAVLLISHGIAYGADQNQQQQPNLAQQAANNPLLENVQQNGLTAEEIAAFTAQLEAFQQQNPNDNQVQNPNNNQQFNVQFNANQLGAAPMVDNVMPAPEPE